MTQLGEMVASGFVDTTKVDCPFHDKKHSHDRITNNYLAGNASTLGDNLADGSATSSTVRRGSSSPDHGFRCMQKYADPDKEYDEETREVQIVKGNGDCKYPVVYSAHHLIPAKESMKCATALHRFIDKGKGTICCNLGYEVDGNENGVWLPGLHAVSSKGLDLWGSSSTDLPDEEEVGRKIVTRTELEDRKSRWSYARLEGPKPAEGVIAFEPTNMKWMYVQKAMTFAEVGTRQFHDRHPHYSSKVCDHLVAVAEVLDRLVGSSQADPTCPKCKNAKDKPLPPIGLLGLLNKSSRWYRGKLIGHTRHKDYYTSSWCGPLAPALRRSRKSNAKK